MQLFYDERDQKANERRGDLRLYWLDDLDAIPIQGAKQTEEGFLFAGARSIEDYQELIKNFTKIKDLPHERKILLELDSILHKLKQTSIKIPQPKTWILRLDEPAPKDLKYPLFLRTTKSSWKCGGKISYVQNEQELCEESELLRRAFGWNIPIMAREWLDIETVGETIFGPVPKEIRVWLIDQKPYAWSFHHLFVVPNPSGFPLLSRDITTIFELGKAVGSVFKSRCIAADFVQLTSGEWIFLEAGPGSCAGTAHEFVFKAVACELVGKKFTSLQGDMLGNVFCNTY